MSISLNKLFVSRAESKLTSLVIHSTPKETIHFVFGPVLKCRGLGPQPGFGLLPSGSEVLIGTPEPLEFFLQPGAVWCRTPMGLWR